MSDIVFLNLEHEEQAFIETVTRERASLKAAVMQVPVDNRATVTNVNASTPLAVYNAIVSARRIIHIAGHGAYFGAKIQSKTAAHQRSYTIGQFADELEADNTFLDVDCVILDSCFSAGYPWRRQLARIVGPGRQLVVIGSALSLGYAQAEEFFETFYADLLSRRLPKSRSAFQQRVYDAFNHAQSDYVAHHGWISRLRVTTLEG